MNDQKAGLKALLSVLKHWLRVGQMVEKLLKWQYVSAAGRALRASLGTRFTRSQVTLRTSALNAYVEDAKCSNWHTHGPQSSQPEADV